MATMPELQLVLLSTKRETQISRFGVVACQGHIHALRQASAQPRFQSQSSRVCVRNLQQDQGNADCHNMHLQSNCMEEARTLSSLVLQGQRVPEAAAGTASGLSTLFLDSFCLTPLGHCETALPCWGCSWPALEAWTGSWTETAA